MPGGVLGRAAQQQPAAAGGRDGEVAADEERQPAEHPLLAQPGRRVEHLAEAVGELDVVGHDVSVASGELGVEARDLALDEGAHG